MSPGDKFLCNGQLCVYHKKHLVRVGNLGPYTQHVAYRLSDGKLRRWTGVEVFPFKPIPVFWIIGADCVVKEFYELPMGASCGYKFMKVGDSEIIDLADGQLMEWTRKHINTHPTKIHVTR